MYPSVLLSNQLLQRALEVLRKRSDDVLARFGITDQVTRDETGRLKIDITNLAIAYRWALKGDFSAAIGPLAAALNMPISELRSHLGGDITNMRDLINGLIARQGIDLTEKIEWLERIEGERDVETRSWIDIARGMITDSLDRDVQYVRDFVGEKVEEVIMSMAEWAAHIIEKVVVGEIERTIIALETEVESMDEAEAIA